MGLNSAEAPISRTGFAPEGTQAQDRKTGRERITRPAPHFARTIDLTAGMRANSPEARQGAALLELLPGAAVLIDRCLRIVQANSSAEALLAEHDGLVAVRQESGAQLAAATGAETRRLRAALLSAVSAVEGDNRERAGPVRISCAADPRTLIVVVTPLPPSAFPLWAAVERGARALVQIVDPHVSAATQAEILQRAIGLTPTEGRVAALVAEGLSTPKVAEALNLSPSTVRTHLARCFDKTGTRSQAALARLVASIPGSR